MADPVKKDDLTTGDLENLSEEVRAFLERYAVRDICPEDITIAMAMKIWNMGDKATHERLDELAREGKMVMVGKVRGRNGRLVMAWQIVKESTDDRDG